MKRGHKSQGKETTKTCHDWGKRRKLKQVAIENKAICREHGWNHPPTCSEVTADWITPPGPGAGRRKPQVYFSQDDTVSAILTARDKGFENNGIVALNFANGKRVGGGYKTGASAQEEDLCRAIPGLYPSLCGAKAKGFYPFGPSAYNKKPRSFVEKRRWRRLYSTVLRTHNLTVQRDSRFRLLPKRKHQLVSLVHAAAPNINFANDEVSEDLLKTMIRGILAPREDPRSVLVLGAWGCGAFGGDPALMSRLFKECIKEVSLPGGGPCYSHIWFAIPPGRNYEVFVDTFRTFRPRILH